MTIILPDNRKPQPPAGVLRGPADASAFRVKVGRYGDRWYADTLPACDIAPTTDAAWPSVSTVKKAKPFEGANYTAMKRIIAERKTIDFAAADAELYDTFKTIDRRSLTAAGDRGTHVHKMAEQMLYGLPVDQKGPGGHYYPALAQFFDAYQPELVCAEFVCIHRDLNGYGYGGTADGGLMIDGQLAIVDWKSRGEDAEHGAYPEEGAQLAAYARAQYVIADGVGMAKRIPVPAFTAGLIVSIKPDGCVVYPVDLDKAWRYTESLHAWWVARLDEKKHIGKPWPIKTVAVEEGWTPTPAADGDGGVEVVAAASPANPFDGLTPGPQTLGLHHSDRIGQTTYDEFQAEYRTLTTAQKNAIRLVAVPAAELGHPISLKDDRSRRIYTIGRALVKWARWDGETTGLRTALGLAGINTDNSIPHTIGTLTLEQADALSAVLTLLEDGAQIVTDDTGQDRIKSAA